MNALQTLIREKERIYKNVELIEKNYLLDIKDCQIQYKELNLDMLKLLTLHYSKKKIDYLLRNYSKLLNNIFAQCNKGNYFQYRLFLNVCDKLI